MTDEAVLKIVIQQEGGGGTPVPDYFVKAIGREFAVFQQVIKDGKALKGIGQGIESYRTREEAEAAVASLRAAAGIVKTELAAIAPKAPSTAAKTGMRSTSLAGTHLRPDSIGATHLRPTSLDQTQIRPEAGGTGMIPPKLPMTEALPPPGGRETMLRGPSRGKTMMAPPVTFEPLDPPEPASWWELNVDEINKRPPGKPIPVFDPVAEAKKRRQRELQREDVQEAYEDLYGQTGKKKSDVGDILKTIRGALGGGISSFLGAAGPAGLAVAAGMEMDRLVKGAIKTGVNLATTPFSMATSPSADPAEGIGKLGEAASKAGEQLGPFSYALTFAGESLKALSGIMQDLTKTAERYGEYNAQIAQAQAIAEIRQTMGDFRRSQVAATELSKFVMAQSDLQQRFEDIKIKALNRLLPLITGAVQSIETIVAGHENIAEAIGVLVRPLSLIATSASELLGLEKDKNLPEVEDPTTQILNPRMFETPNVGGFAPDR